MGNTGNTAGAESMEKLGLKKWVEADRILMDDFNQNNEAIARALLGLMGKAEKIGVAHSALSNSAASSIDLSDIDWGSYQAVILAAPDYVDAAYKFSFSAAGTSSTSSNSSTAKGNLGEVNAAPYVLIFLPLGDSSQTVKMIYIGGSAGVGTATCTYEEFTGLRLNYSKSGHLYFSVVHDYPLWGIR